jgi:putative transposase
VVSGHEPIPQRERRQPAALTTAERKRLLALLARKKYAALSLSQTFYRAWDDGHWVASKSTWYRVARSAEVEMKPRRRASTAAKKIPELVADAPSQVWSWDITKLKGPRYGQYFHWYVIIDIFSRKIVGWRLEEYEDSAMAAGMVTAAVTANGSSPQYFHSDNGAAMVSKPIGALLERLGITRSFSRPKVSNDNPYSEALFKTGKYVPQFPGHFDSVDYARDWARWFVHEYNNHRHSGIGYHTPDDVHRGLTAARDIARTATLTKAWQEHPERFSKPPQPPRLPSRATINDPLNRTQTTLTLSHTG